MGRGTRFHGLWVLFYSMAWTQDVLTPPGERVSLTTSMISGGVAGLAFWVAGLPLDTIKTWVQGAVFVFTCVGGASESYFAANLS